MVNFARTVRKFWKKRKERKRRSTRQYNCRNSPGRFNVLNLLILGNENVGKTSIGERLAFENATNIKVNVHGEEFFRSTIFLRYDNKTVGKQCDLHVTIGQKRRMRESVENYKKQLTLCDGCILVYSKDDRQSYVQLVELISDIRKIRRHSIPIVILGNKTDLQQSFNHPQEKAVLGGYPHYDVSALQNFGLPDSFKRLVELCVESSGTIHM